MTKKQIAEKKNSEPGKKNFQGKAFDRTAALAAVTMRGGNFFQRLIVYLCYFIGTIALAILSVPPYETNKQLMAGGGAVVCIAFALIFVLVQYKNLTATVVPSGPVAEMPTPGMMPLSQADVDALLKLLQQARAEAFKFFHAKDSSVMDGDIRANMFFPHYGPSGSWDDCVLKIRPPLHINMKSEAELDIVLVPGQGVTGDAFATGLPSMGRRLDEDSAIGWPKKHHITPELEKVLHPDLKWVFSMPLRGVQRPLAVMTIDGLKHDFDIEALRLCSMTLTEIVFSMEGYIRR